MVLHLMARNLEAGLEQAMVQTMGRVKGAYSMIVMTEDTIIAARDPSGFRPLCLGKLGPSYVLASETCAFDLVEGEYIRDDATLEEAVHMLVMGGHHSLLVTKNGEIVGILRLTDVFVAIFDIMKSCEI